MRTCVVCRRSCRIARVVCDWLLLVEYAGCRLAQLQFVKLQDLKRSHQHALTHTHETCSLLTILAHVNIEPRRTFVQSIPYIPLFHSTDTHAHTLESLNLQKNTTSHSHTQHDHLIPHSHSHSHSQSQTRTHTKSITDKSPRQRRARTCTRWQRAPRLHRSDRAPPGPVAA